MTVAIAEARPPYVSFAFKSEENRQASIEAGHYVAKDVAYAYITPQGSKDRIERRADEWLLHLEQQAKEDRIPKEWVRFFKESFEAWKKEEELPVNGTPIKNWPAMSPAQVEMITRAGIQTVEDLAAANEEALKRIGMGARALKERALSYTASKGNTAQVAEENAALKAQLTDLSTRNDTLQTQVNELKAAVAALSPPPAQQTTKL